MQRLAKHKYKLALAASLLVISALTATYFLKPGLYDIHCSVAASFDTVEHISADSLVARQDEVVLFDVREPEEFDVSHIAGAIQLSPAISVDEFDTRYGDLLAGKQAVFYCSVGWRSSELAARVNDVVYDNDGLAVVNLVGGIFQWSNDNRALVNTLDQATDKVHPYNAYWGRLVENKAAISLTKE